MNSNKISLNKISLKKIRDLKVSAASGLVKIDKNFFVIADDELSLAYFNISSAKENKFTLLPGDLPEDHKKRKQIKPDWESLCLLPQNKSEQTRLLAVPSGSKKNRTVGALIEIDKQVPQNSKQIDFSEIFEELSSQFSELNIEGATVADHKLILLQRGNASLKQNALIELDYPGVYSDLTSTKTISKKRIVKVKPFELGSLNGNPLGFTDACFDGPDKLYFLAVAENTVSTYDDGEYQGSILGCFDRNGKIIFLTELDCPFKPEGLWVESSKNGSEIFVVTDADDRNQSASLYTANF